VVSKAYEADDTEDEFGEEDESDTDDLAALAHILFPGALQTTVFMAQHPVTNNITVHVCV